MNMQPTRNIEGVVLELGTEEFQGIRQIYLTVQAGGETLHCYWLSSMLALQRRQVHKGAKVYVELLPDMDTPMLADQRWIIQDVVMLEVSKPSVLAFRAQMAGDSDGRQPEPHPAGESEPEPETERPADSGPEKEPAPRVSPPAPEVKPIRVWVTRMKKLPGAVQLDLVPLEGNQKINGVVVRAPALVEGFNSQVRAGCRLEVVIGGNASGEMEISRASLLRAD